MRSSAFALVSFVKSQATLFLTPHALSMAFHASKSERRAGDRHFWHFWHRRHFWHRLWDRRRDAQYC